MTKIKEIRIENFQSHQKTVIPLSTGFNVFVGASDQGKSAIIRALRWVLFNEPRGSDFIRAGSSVCRVEILLDNGTKIIRQRSTGTNRYILQKEGKAEEIFEGFGNTVPQEIIAAHGIRKVDFDGEKEIILNLAGQLQAPFLLDENGALKAKALGRINGVHFIDYAQRDTVRDLTKLQAKEQDLKKRQEEIEEELKAFADLPRMKEKIDSAEKFLENISKAQERKTKLKSLLEKYDTVQNELKEIFAVLEATVNLDEASNKLRQAELQFMRFNSLRRHQEKLGKTEATLKKSLKIIEYTAQNDMIGNCLQKAENLLQKKNKLVKSQEKYLSLEKSLKLTGEILNKTKGISKAEEKIAFLKDYSAKLNSLKRKRASLQRIEIEYKSLEPILASEQRLQKTEKLLEKLADKKTKLETLNKIYLKLSQISERLKRAENFYKEHGLQYEKLLAEYAQTLKSLGRCPYCFNPLEKSEVEKIISKLKF